MKISSNKFRVEARKYDPRYYVGERPLVKTGKNLSLAITWAQEWTRQGYWSTVYNFDGTPLLETIYLPTQGKCLDVAA